MNIDDITDEWLEEQFKKGLFSKSTQVERQIYIKEDDGSYRIETKKCTVYSSVR